MSGLFGSVQYLTTHMGNESLRSANTIKRVAASGDPVKQASMQGQGAGDVSLAANLLNGTVSKRSSINAFQNGMNFLQAQADGLRQAEKIYHRMLDLASLAVDPMIGDDERVLLSEQFESLRQESLTLGKSTLNGVALFDEAAASTRYDISFGSQLSDQSGISVEEKDVLYSSGTIEIDVNGGTAGETYSLWQGSQKLFDSGYWETAGSARSFDYDRFIIEFGPNKPTTFQFKPMSAGDGTNVFLDDAPGYPHNLVDDGNFENKRYYLQQLLGTTTDENGLTTSDPNYKKTSGWESREGRKYTTLRKVTTQDSNSNLTNLRLEVNSSTWFQVRGRYIPPEAESSVVGHVQDLQVSLKPIGLGLLRENNDANGFPVINVSTLENAQKAIDSIANEIKGLAQQIGNVGSNMRRVEHSMDAAQKQIATGEQALSGVAREDLALQMLKVTKDRIARSQNAAMLSQAINLNYAVVNMII